MKMRYVHTNLVAKDWKKLSEFYQTVFACVSIGAERDLSGDWVDRLTGISGAHIRGEHLILPGYEGEHPTLEIFSYEQLEEENSKRINHIGLGHLAFEVEDVAEKLQEILDAGGGQVGEIVETIYPNQTKAKFVYARDIEGNIIELQSWAPIKKQEKS